MNNRNKTIDTFRIIAIIGVISMHVQNSSPSAEKIGAFFWPLAVPFFYMVSLYFFNKGHFNSNNSLVAIKKIINRLLIPFFVWTAIYFSLRLIKIRLTGGGDNMEVWKAFFYGNSAVHLYFIPNLIIMQLLSWAFLIVIYNRTKWMLSLSLILFCLVYLYIGARTNCFGFSYNSFFIVFLCVLLGMGISKLDMSNRIAHQAVLWVGTLICTLIIWINFSQYHYLLDSAFAFPISGCGTLLLAIGLNNKLKLPDWITSTSYGVYLCHIIFLEAFELGLKVLHIDFYYGFFQKIIVILFIFICSVISTHLIRRNKWTKVILLGEK